MDQGTFSYFLSNNLLAMKDSGVYSYIKVYELVLMMPFFNRNWAGACSGCWVGLGLILGWSAGCASPGLG